MALQSAWPQSPCRCVLAAAGHNFRRLFAWLTFLLLGILIALGLAAQPNRPEIGFFTAALI
jgi:fumarate reductase subunit D